MFEEGSEKRSYGRKAKGKDVERWELGERQENVEREWSKEGVKMGVMEGRREEKM